MRPKNRKPRRTGAGLRGVRQKLRAAFRLAEPRVRLALRHHRNTRGRPMTFDRRPYLLPIYLDRSAERVFKKSVQCGISEFLIIDAFESAARGLACLYVMPTQEKRDKFVANRVTRAINASPHHRRLVRSGPGKANSSRMKHLGDGVISFVGSNAENEFVEFPADLVIVDEVDRCNLNNLPLARDRLAASPHKLIAYASTPTYAEVGIAALYDESDAREWHVRCDHCGRRQPLDFFTNVARQTGTDEYELLDREWQGAPNPKSEARHAQQIPNHKHQAPNNKSQSGGARAERPAPALQNSESDVPSSASASAPDVRVFCAYCGRPIDRLGDGEWVARHPGRAVAGYHISQLFVPTIRVARLWADWGKA
ncbi:MAG: phage terminase large subunit family protein, partial [bacterium]